MKNVVYLFCFVLGALGFSQTPELFYEDGGDLGPLEIRDGKLYYISHQVGLKQLDIDTPDDANLIVQTEGIYDISHIFWGTDASQVYFSNTVFWYKSPFEINDVSTAIFFRDFLGQHSYEIKQYNFGYLFSITDFGTFFGTLSNVDPFNVGPGGGGFIDSSSRNLALQENTVYFSHTLSGNSAQSDFNLFRGALDDFNNTQELLFEFNEPIGQIETFEELV